MSDMPLKEVADLLDAYAVGYRGCNGYAQLASVLAQAASLVRKVDAGEYVQLSCKQCVPDGLRDCAGSRDEWFRDEHCVKCRKYWDYVGKDGDTHA